jgi:hypothetical protein
MYAVPRPTCKRSAPARQCDCIPHNRRKALSVVYLVALIAVCMALFGALAEAVWSMSRKPAWSQPRLTLSPMITMERRTHLLPFVGKDRRRATTADPHSEVDKLAA